MHEGLKLVGPGIWVAVAGFFAVAGLALYVTYDSLRRPPSAFDVLPEARWVYSVPQAVYVVLFALSLMPGGISRIVGVWLSLATPLVFAGQIAYFLRVVYPPVARHQARAELERERLEAEMMAPARAREADDPPER